MIKQTDKLVLDKIRNYYAENGILPGYRYINMMAGYKSTNASYKLVQRLIKAGYLKKIDHKIAPDNLFSE